MDKSNRHISKEDFIRYLNGEMDNRERNEFERTLEVNPFEKEALEGMELISTEELSSDLDELKQKIYSPKKRSRSWYRIAAVAAILILGAGTIYTLLIQKPVTPTVTEIRMEEKQEPFPEKNKSEEFSLIKPQIADSSERMDKPLPRYKEEPVKDNSMAKMISPPEKKSEPIGIVSDELAEVSITKESESGQEEIEAAVNQEGQAVSELSIHALKSRQSNAQAVPVMLTDTKPKGYSAQAKKQNFMVSGLVVSGEDSTPLPGVAVTLKGSKYGTLSDSNGQFNLEMPADTNLPIIARYVGMETKQLSDYNKSGNVITLEPDISEVSEVVVTSSGKNSEELADLKTEAEPEIGYREFYKEMKEKCLIPENYTPAKKSVKLKLTISPQGVVSNIEAMNSPDSLLLKKSIELIKSGPSWTPATIEENPVESTAVIKLRFHK